MSKSATRRNPVWGREARRDEHEWVDKLSRTVGTRQILASRRKTSGVERRAMGIRTFDHALDVWMVEQNYTGRGCSLAHADVGLS